MLTFHSYLGIQITGQQLPGGESDWEHFLPSVLLPSA